jgi:sarcosine oxidase, subunit gamma
MAELVGLPPQDRFVLRGAGCLEFGLGLPGTPCSTASDWALWLGPDEWLLLAEAGAGAALRARIGEAAGGRVYALVDVSQREVAMQITGGDAADVLNGGVPLDLSEKAFPVGMCTRTVCGKAEIILWRRRVDSWRIDVARSYAGYVRGLLSAAAACDEISLLVRAGSQMPDKESHRENTEGH